ncbi:hypothetical protein KOAAANKH_01685 [Brevundimonas sp. NIBR10]|nr:hypothetical protein KOAAANKH_01685 [Brevundimonas sp. NIBR10]
MTDKPVHDSAKSPVGRKPRGRTKVSQTDLARVFRAAKQERVSAQVIYDGFRVVVNGSSEPDTEPNEWDSVL